MAQKDIALILTFDDRGSITVKKAVGNVKKELTGLSNTAKQTGTGFKTMSAQTKETTTGMSKMKSILKSTAGQMAIGLGTMFGVQAAIRGIRTAVKSTIEAGREFEREWANTTTMLTISAQETEKLKWELMTLSPTLGDTADLARGMYQVLSASVEPAKAIEFLGVAAMSAKAGVTDTTTAVDALTTVINAYGMQAEEVTKVSDIMFQAVKRGKLTYGGLSGALGTVVPMAAKVGLGFEEVAAAMATLTRQGIDVNTTSVQLRQILVSVLKPTSQAQAMAKELGLEFNSTALRAKGLSGFLADVNEKTKGNSDSLTMLFGNVRALTGVMGLAGAGAKGFAKDLELMKTASGSTRMAFEKQMKSADFMMKTFKTSIKKLQIAFYQGITTSFAKGIKNADDFEKKITALIYKAKQFGETMAIVGSVLKDFISYLLKGGAVGSASADILTKHTMHMLKLKTMDEAVIDKTIELTREIEGFTKSLKILTVDQETLEKTFSKGGKQLDEWKDKMQAADKQMAKAKDPYFGLMGVIKQQSEAVREHVGWILEDAKSSEEASKRIDTYKKSLKEATKATECSSIVEKLGLKTKFQLGVELQDLVKNINEARASGKVYDSQLQGMAKQAAALSKITGGKLSPTIVKLAEDLDKVSKKTKEVNVAGSLDVFTIGAVAATKAIKEMQEATSLLGVNTIPQLEMELANLEKAYKTVGQRLTPEDQVTAVDKIIGAYQHLGKEVPLQYQLISIMGHRTNAKIIADTEKTTKKVALDWTKSFSILSGIFNTLSDDYDGAMKQLLSATGSAFDAIGNYFGSLKEGAKASFEGIVVAIGPVLGQIGGAIGSLISGTTKNFAGLGSSIGSTVGEIAGSIIPGLGKVGKAVGGLLGGIIGGLFKKAKTEAEKFQEQVNGLVKSVSKWGDISEDTAKKIAEDTKEMEGCVAVSKNYADVLRDVGITQKSINDQWNRASAILQHYNSGLLDASDASQAAGESFTQLLDSAVKFGTEGSAAMVGFINQVKASGLEVKEVTDYINEQLGVVKGGTMNAIQGLEAMAGSVGTNVEALGRLENQTLAVYNAMIANGASYSEVMASLGGVLDSMLKKYEELGIEGSAGIQELLKIREVTEANKGLFDAMEGNLAVLNALANTGSLTQQTFTDAAVSATSYYNQMMEAGLTSNQALTQMGPTLERLRYLAKEHGLEIDDTTQALIKQAEEQGILGEQQMSMQDTLMAGFGAIIEAIGGEIPDAFKRAMGKMDEFASSSDTAFERVRDGVRGIQDDLSGLHAPDLTFDVSGDFSQLEAGMRNYQMPAEPGGGEIHAQTGYHGVVTEPVQRFVAHRGEQVDIWRRDETARGVKEENINVTIEPVVIEKNNEYVINFMTKKIERAGVRIPIRAVRGE